MSSLNEIKIRHLENKIRHLEELLEDSKRYSRELEDQLLIVETENEALKITRDTWQKIIAQAPRKQSADWANAQSPCKDNLGKDRGTLQ